MKQTLVQKRRMRRARGRIVVNTYVTIHTGTLIVLGSAAHGVAEAEHVIANRPDYRVAAVGHAAANMKANFVVTDHYEVHEELRRLQSEFGKDFTTHCTLCSGPQRYPAVDHWWVWPRPTCTSAWTAIRIGIYCQFDEIILCGVPMSFGLIQHPLQRAKDGTVWPPPPVYKTEDPTRYVKTSEEVLNEFRYEFVSQCLEFKGRVFSMSGFTRDALGFPLNMQEVKHDLSACTISR